MVGSSAYRSTKALPGIRFPEAPLEGRFLRRYKRFFADVELEDGSVVTAHCPNTGSLLGCLEAGRPVWLRDSHDDKRKLRCTWQAIRMGRSWVNVDTSLPNRVVAEALALEAIAGLTGYQEQRREVRYGQNSRIDILLQGEGRRDCYIEVKSTTLRRGHVALFPDAVTARGKKHLEELVSMVAEGHRAVQFFFVSRGDVRSLRPADDIDPEYGTALRRAADRGVEVMAWKTRVRARSLELARPIPVELG